MKQQRLIDERLLRDEQIFYLRQLGAPFRVIGERFGLHLMTVRGILLKRERYSYMVQRRSDKETTDAIDALIAGVQSQSAAEAAWVLSDIVMSHKDENRTA